MGNEKQFHDYLQRPKNRSNNKDEKTVTSDQDFLLQLKEKLESGKKNKRDGVAFMLQKPNPGGEVISTPVDHLQEAQPRGSQIKLQEFYQMLLDKGNKEVKDT